MNLRATPEAISVLLERKNRELLTTHKVMSEAEIRSRYEIQLDIYCKTVRIEAMTMIDMAHKDILPAVAGYTATLAKSVTTKMDADTGFACGYEKKLLRKLGGLLDLMDAKTEELESAVMQPIDKDAIAAEAEAMRDRVLPVMCELRALCDEAETVMPGNVWPVPTYGELLLSER